MKISERIRQAASASYQRAADVVQNELVNVMRHVIKEIMPEIKKLDLSDRKAAVHLYGALFGLLGDYGMGLGPNWEKKKKFFPGDPKPEHQKWIKTAPDARLATIIKQALKDHPEILKAFDEHQIDKKKWV